jgi:hypothetical protein
MRKTMPVKIPETTLIETGTWRSSLKWILPVLFKPTKGLQEITSRDKAFWLTPLVAISLAALLSILVAGPIRTQQAQMGTNLPTDFQYYTPEQQQQFTQAQQTSSSPLFAYVFPAITLLAGVWISWVLLGGMLHLGLTLAGSRSSSLKSLNLTAWSGLPFAVRYLIQAVYILFTRNLIASEGLSGLATIGSFFSAFLKQVDIYLVWQIVLVFVGVPMIAGMARRKAWLVTGIVLLILLILSSLPSFAVSRFSGVGPIQPFFSF